MERLMQIQQFFCNECVFYENQMTWDRRYVIFSRLNSKSVMIQSIDDETKIHRAATTIHLTSVTIYT